MAVWLRLSANRQLDWYRNSNYQSKDIAHIQKVIAQRMADKVSMLSLAASWPVWHGMPSPSPFQRKQEMLLSSGSGVIEGIMRFQSAPVSLVCQGS